MSLQHLSTKPTIHAGHEISVHGSSGRNHWGSLDDRFRCRFTEPTEGLMDSGYEDRKLIGGDLIPPDISGDNFCHEIKLLAHVIIRHCAQARRPLEF